MGGREPGRLASLAAGGLIQLLRTTQGAALGGRPWRSGVQNMGEHVRMWIDGGCRLSELKTILIHVG
jgi:hypothetical protein